MARLRKQARFSPLLERVTDVLSHPQAAWARIETEDTDVRGVYQNYLVYLAAISALAGFIGLCLVGANAWSTPVRVPWLNGLGHMVTGFVLTLLSVFLLSLVVDVLAPVFNGQRNATQALKLVAYSATPVLLAGVCAVVPELWWVVVLSAGYSAALFFLGAPVLMRVPADQAVLYTALLSGCLFVLSLVVRAVGTVFTGVGV